MAHYVTRRWWSPESPTRNRRDRMRCRCVCVCDTRVTRKSRRCARGVVSQLCTETETAVMASSSYHTFLFLRLLMVRGREQQPLTKPPPSTGPLLGTHATVHRAVLTTSPRAGPYRSLPIPYVTIDHRRYVLSSRERARWRRPQQAIWTRRETSLCSQRHDLAFALWLSEDQGPRE
jgi:hypothetical protein